MGAKGSEKASAALSFQLQDMVAFKHRTKLSALLLWQRRGSFQILFGKQTSDLGWFLCENAFSSDRRRIEGGVHLHGLGLPVAVQSVDINRGSTKMQHWQAMSSSVSFVSADGQGGRRVLRLTGRANAVELRALTFAKEREIRKS